jgi:hypothetical protein
VVRRLVQQERLGLSEERLRQQHPHFLSALELRHFPIVELFGNIEPLQQDGRVALRAVAVLLADDPFELAEPHAVFVGHRRLGVEVLALFERSPQTVVPHDHRVDDPEAVEGIVILTEHPDLLGTHDRALLRLKLTGQQLHEGGLAGAVRPGEPVAATRRKRGGDVLEEHLRAVPHRNTVD